MYYSVNLRVSVHFQTLSPVGGWGGLNHGIPTGSARTRVHHRTPFSKNDKAKSDATLPQSHRYKPAFL